MMVHYHITAFQINDMFGFQSGVKVKVVGEETSSHYINIEKTSSHYINIEESSSYV